MEPSAPCTTPTPQRRPRRRLSLRAGLTQGALAIAAIAGAVSMTRHVKPRHDAPVAVALVARPVRVGPTLTAVAMRDSATRLAAHFQRKGYPISPTLATAIADAAHRHAISIDVAFGLARTESGFSNGATSRVGAIGLTQLMPRTARWLKPGTTRHDLRDPATNADLGFAYLRQLIDRYQGDVDLALLAYNRGPATVDRIRAQGGDPDNGYAAKVRGRGA
jgi:soluble lytic murein transglycosylase-like protein